MNPPRKRVRRDYNFDPIAEHELDVTTDSLLCVNPIPPSTFLTEANGFAHSLFAHGLRLVRKLLLYVAGKAIRELLKFCIPDLIQLLIAYFEQGRIPLELRSQFAR